MSAKPMMVADIVEKVAKGQIGHREAMDRLGLRSYPELIDTLHANGKSVWAHRPPRPDAKSMVLLAVACGISRGSTDIPEDTMTC